MPSEVEIKFAIHELEAIRERLRRSGFREITPRTREMNTLYDRGGELRARGEVLRIRQYGEKWTLTHKSKSKTATKHKTRTETESAIADGEALDRVFRALGFEPRFQYEKFRSEWTDGQGHVVLDETPVGNFGEIEGTPEWIDRVAGLLEMAERDYINKSYAELFLEWKEAHGSDARNMTFEELGEQPSA